MASTPETSGQTSDTCLSCGRSCIKEVAVVDGGYHIYECAACDLLFVNPMPTDDFLTQFYNKDYPHDCLPTAPYGIRRKRFGMLARRVRHALLKQGVRDFSRATFFEIGVGGGDFVRQIAATGVRVAGSDLSIKAPLVGSEFTIRVGRFEEFGYQSEFEVIFASHVIEHVNDPRGFVNAVARALKPAGRAVIVTPNRHSLSMRLVELFKPKNKWITLVSHPPVHLVGFNQKGMRALFESCQLDVEEVTTLPCNESFFHPFAEFVVKLLVPYENVASVINRALKKICVPFDLLWMTVTPPLFARFFLGEELLIVAKKPRQRTNGDACATSS